MEMFSTWFISFMTAWFLVSILMERDVEASPVPNLDDDPLDSNTQNSEANNSNSDIDYEVYAYYLPFLKEQNVSNEKADYSYYENDYLSYYSDDKSLEDKRNPNHLTEEDEDDLIEMEREEFTDDHQNDTELKSLPDAAEDELLTTKSDLTTIDGSQNDSDESKSTMTTSKDDAFLKEVGYLVDDSLQDVTEPYSPENNSSKFIYRRIVAGVTESSLQDVTEPVILLKTGVQTKRIDSATHYHQDAVESGILNKTKGIGANKEVDLQNICLRSVEEGFPYSMLFPCSSFEIPSACIGVDHRIEACSKIGEANEVPRPICVKKENPPYVVACNDPFSEAFCFESSSKDRIIPCQDNGKRLCLFGKGHLEICSSVGYGNLAI